MRRRLIRGSPLALLALLAAPPPARSDPKLTPDEVVARHLQSLGSPEAIQKVQSRALNATIESTTQFGRAGTLPGKGSVVSKGTRTRVNIRVEDPEYPGEYFACDGQKVTAASLIPGVRTPLSSFIFQNAVLMREGLIGGVLTTAWPLLDLPARKPLLSYGGLKKVEGKQYHTLKYRPAKGAMPASVTLYFDSESFRHVRTEINLDAGSGSAATAPRIGESARPDGNLFQVVEEFGDFQDSDGLQLPRAYTIRYSGSTRDRTVMATWKFTVTELAHNPPLDDQVFNIR
jgi:hypothetical protein